MSTHLIGIAQMKITKDSSDVLTAPNLGSCVAVAVFDPIRKIGGMIHCLWKNSLLMKASDFGEDYSRTVSLDMKDGSVSLKAKGETKLLA